MRQQLCVFAEPSPQEVRALGPERSHGVLPCDDGLKDLFSATWKRSKSACSCSVLRPGACSVPGALDLASPWPAPGATHTRTASVPRGPEDPQVHMGARGRSVTGRELLAGLLGSRCRSWASGQLKSLGACRVHLQKCSAARFLNTVGFSHLERLRRRGSVFARVTWRSEGPGLWAGAGQARVSHRASWWTAHRSCWAESAIETRALPRVESTAIARTHRFRTKASVSVLKRVI